MQKVENIIYANHIILGQIITAANSPDDIEPYEHVENEVKLVRPLYNEQTGEFLGLRKSLAFINVLGEKEESFKDKSKVLYVAQKIVIPHVFSGNVFKQYQN